MSELGFPMRCEDQYEGSRLLITMKNIGLANGIIGIDTWQILTDVTRSEAVFFFAYRFRLGYVVLGTDFASY
jgi:hypothetical protein